eukprot:CAMPEP_0197928472 /NCGR_PEP_ID=MMETSP1439-20131203/102419_1 /TAXON_ID=66791 /ORGANISM="Gonyaulax spinifera, Strain CCMP409" /LENGTH=42 /DNA_ID= /DNA_START= /DNA_END= /DNA_ORIENTATION=
MGTASPVPPPVATDTITLWPWKNNGEMKTQKMSKQNMMERRT